jgi:hypothetical protein
LRYATKRFQPSAAPEQKPKRRSFPSNGVCPTLFFLPHTGIQPIDNRSVSR